jgi:hypothetical protein
MKMISGLLLSICMLVSIGCQPADFIVEKPAPAPAPAATTAAVPEVPAGIAQKAEVGVGIRGDSLRKEEGVGKIIASSAVAYFNTKEKIVFEIHIPHALNLYKALEGNFPKTHEQFMNKIIKENQIQLPELKPGMQYKYRPDLGELWVEPIEAAKQGS